MGGDHGPYWLSTRSNRRREVIHFPVDTMVQRDNGISRSQVTRSIAELVVLIRDWTRPVGESTWSQSPLGMLKAGTSLLRAPLLASSQNEKQVSRQSSKHDTHASSHQRWCPSARGTIGPLLDCET
jgi:hypothetical protein